MTRFARIASLAVAALAAGCSLVLSTADPVQCHSNADCEVNAALRGRTCESGFCVIPRAPVGPVSTDGGAGCVSSELCTQANSNRASVCRTAGGSCVPLQTTACPTVRGAWTDPDAIFIGVIAPMTYLQADGTTLQVPYTDRMLRGLDLAFEEITPALGEGVLVGSKRRPLAMIQCNSFADGDRARAAFNHLTDVAGAHAVIVMTDRDLEAVAADAAKNSTAILCSDCIAPLPDNRLAWRHMPGIANEAPLAAWRVRDLEARIRQQTNTTAPIRVALLAEFGPSAGAFVDAFLPIVTFNGGQGSSQADFLAVVTPDPHVENVAHAKHAAKIVGFAPDVIVAAVGPDFPTHYLSLIEETWPSTKAPPSYVLTDLSYEVTPFASPTAIGSNDALRTRISGVHPRVTPELRANIDAYALRYRARYGSEEPDSNYSGYESLYSLTFAILRASTQPLLDGPHISSGFERLVSGTTFDYGPAKLKTGIALLLSEGTIDARGLWSTLDWDVSKRSFDTDTSMFCFRRDASGKLLLHDEAGTAVFSHATRTVTGQYSCD